MLLTPHISKQPVNARHMAIDCAANTRWTSSAATQGAISTVSTSGCKLRARRRLLYRLPHHRHCRQHRHPPCRYHRRRLRHRHHRCRHAHLPRHRHHRRHHHRRARRLRRHPHSLPRCRPRRLPRLRRIFSWMSTTASPRQISISSCSTTHSTPSPSMDRILWPRGTLCASCPLSPLVAMRPRAAKAPTRPAR